ncbi:MAG: dTDP-glucose 4,6-dehydratase [Ignavibacteria bacterium]|jgi:dTDP-glucose 4,6-dehydratase|nr:dTDP-glucose 4,6-dehydratase [Ignavibacteria bacterium]
MNLLITGGNGFIGYNFTKYVLANCSDCEVICLDSNTYAANIVEISSSRYHFVRGDIRDGALVGGILADYDIDRIINFAAETHVDNSIANPNLFVETNVLGTAVLLQKAREFWGIGGDNLYFQVSTDEVYGEIDADGAKFTEDSIISPRSPYSASKAGADLLVKAYFDTYNLPVVTTRCSNNYGFYQHREKFIPLIITNALLDKPIPVYGDGNNVRDWIFVLDHCSALWSVLTAGESVVGKVYNIGANCEMRNIDLVKFILDYLKKPASLITFVEDRLGHDRRYAIDATKIGTDIGWRAESAFETSMIATIDWYVARYGERK